MAEALLETVQSLVDSDDPTTLPEAPRNWVATQTRDPWAFLGDSWRDAVVGLVRAHLEGDDEGRFGFNTANVPKVRGLYCQILGFSPLRDIRWQKKRNPNARKEISTLVSGRGEIVHRGTTPDALSLGGVRSWAGFVRRLVTKFDQRLAESRSGLTSGNKK